MPMAANSKAPRNRSSLSRKSVSMCFCASISNEIPTTLVVLCLRFARPRDCGRAIILPASAIGSRTRTDRSLFRKQYRQRGVIVCSHDRGHHRNAANIQILRRSPGSCPRFGGRVDRPTSGAKDFPIGRVDTLSLMTSIVANNCKSASRWPALVRSAHRSGCLREFPGEFDNDLLDNRQY